jgi:hypothetical protein
MKEVQPYAGPTMTSAMQAAVVLNQATTIPLPTDEDWRQAVAKDHDLSQIAQALQDGPLNSLSKAELVEKAYFEEWKQERLVVDDGIVYRLQSSQQGKHPTTTHLRGPTATQTHHHRGMSCLPHGWT